MKIYKILEERDYTHPITKKEIKFRPPKISESLRILAESSSQEVINDFVQIGLIKRDQKGIYFNFNPESEKYTDSATSEELFDKKLFDPNQIESYNERPVELSIKDFEHSKLASLLSGNNTHVFEILNKLINPQENKIRLKGFNKKELLDLTNPEINVVSMFSSYVSRGSDDKILTIWGLNTPNLGNGFLYGVIAGCV